MFFNLINIESKKKNTKKKRKEKNTNFIFIITYLYNVIYNANNIKSI